MRDRVEKALERAAVVVFEENGLESGIEIKVFSLQLILRF